MTAHRRDDQEVAAAINLLQERGMVFVGLGPDGVGQVIPFGPQKTTTKKAPRGRRWSRAKFLELLADGKTVQRAAELAGTNRETIRRTRGADPDFDRDYQDALAASRKARYHNNEES